MKALLNLILLATLGLSTHAFSESYSLADDGSLTVADLSFPNQKKLWQNCIDRQLDKLDPSHPNYFEMGQQIGDICTSSRIIRQ